MVGSEVAQLTGIVEADGSVGAGGPASADNAVVVVLLAALMVVAPQLLAAVLGVPAQLAGACVARLQAADGGGCRPGATSIAAGVMCPYQPSYVQQLGW